MIWKTRSYYEILSCQDIPVGEEAREIKTFLSHWISKMLMINEDVQNDLLDQ